MWKFKWKQQQNQGQQQGQSKPAGESNENVASQVDKMEHEKVIR